MSLTLEMWQALPGNINGVNVGPDGRAWYEAQVSRFRCAGTIAERMAHRSNSPARSPVLINDRVAASSREVAFGSLIIRTGLSDMTARPG